MTSKYLIVLLIILTFISCDQESTIDTHEEIKDSCWIDSMPDRYSGSTVLGVVLDSSQTDSIIRTQKAIIFLRPTISQLEKLNADMEPGYLEADSDFGFHTTTAISALSPSVDSINVIYSTERFIHLANNTIDRDSILYGMILTNGIGSPMIQKGIMVSDSYIECIDQFFNAATLDKWSIRLNDSLVAEFNEDSANIDVYIDSTNVSEMDSISILHLTDSLCSNCYIAFIAKDSRGDTKIQTITPTENNSVSFSLEKLIYANNRRCPNGFIHVTLVKRTYEDMKTRHWKLVNIHFN
jgi:hypothetical protein